LIKNDFTDLFAHLDVMKENAYAGIDHALDDVAPLVKADMQSTTAHGDVTGATRAGYTAYRIGHGRDGSSESAESLDAVGFLNPGHSAPGNVTLHGQVGLVLMSGTDYQVKLETENGGQKAVLGPTLQAWYLLITQLAAQGAKDNL